MGKRLTANDEICGPEHCYEIFFKDAAGQVGATLKVVALDDEDAKSIAAQMRGESNLAAYVMHYGKLVAAVYPPIEY